MSRAGDGMTVIARTLGHCTVHATYEHDCPYCRDAELQVARWSDVKTDAALAATLRGAVSREHAVQAIGWLSAEVAVHGAPSLGPEWLELWDRALTATGGQ
jgi:hypothetical protein